MNRITIIQELINKNNYKKYLEIGVRDGSCFNLINCENKIGVDPDTGSSATVFKTSDDFFKDNKETFDIVFIDGMHEALQVERDILNSLKCLNKGGTIVMHDCLPTTKRMQEIPLQEQNEWTGNVWKAYLKFRMTRADLDMCVVNCDWGTGIIRPGEQKVVVTEQAINYENFCLYKEKWMNVISVEQFKAKYL